MDDLLNSLLQTVLTTLVQVLAPILIGLLINWVFVQIQRVKASMSAEQLDFVTNLARQLVLAAEQNGLKDQLMAEGKAKKEYVLSRLEELLKQKGIKLDLNVLSDIVEAAVYEELTTFKGE